MDYLYDGSFEGALSGIYRMFKDKGQTDEQSLSNELYYQKNLVSDSFFVVTNESDALRVADSIIKTFGEEGFKTIAYGFLSKNENYGTLLYRCLKRAYKLGTGAMDCLSNTDILNMHKEYKKVVREMHLMTGFIRFMELENGVYYAQIEPTYDILGLVLPHFKDRFSDQMWVIHDTRRKIAAFYNKVDYFINDLDELNDFKLSLREMDYQSLWKTYFNHISIAERKNLSLQRQLMPKKYWRFLIEK